MATLADLQTEREKLRAAQAKQDFESAHAETCSQAELLAAALAVRKVIFDSIDAAGAQLLDAIRGERDETRVHYLMSDCVHDLLAGIGDRAALASTALPVVGEQVKRGIKPRELLTVSQWADKYRELKSGTNAPGRWHTALTPYLAEIMDCLSEHSAVRQVTFIKSSGVGGPLALDTPIPTPDGWTTMGEIQAGALVFDEHGQTCGVTYVSPVFDGRRCYEIEFSDGAVITCDGEHRWTVDDRFPGHTGKQHGVQRGAVTLNTEEIAASFLTNGRQRFAIPVCGALTTPDAALPIPPYVLGYWLANGNLSGNQMTAHEDDAAEIAAHLSESGWCATARKLATDKGRAANIILAVHKNESGKCLRGHVLVEVGTFSDPAGNIRCSECHRQHAMHSKYDRTVDAVVREPGFLTRLAALGIGSKNHIPRLYLRASAEQRAELLRGLMDGDGCIGTNGRCEYSTVSGGLAGAVMELAYSLGLKPTRYTVPRRGFSGRPAREPGFHHRIGFVAYDDLPVFKLQRKLTRQPSRQQGNPSIVGRRFIADVRPVASRPVRCIAVNSPSHLYLCGREMIPTHNTEAMNNWIGYIMHHLQNKDLLVVVPTLELRDRSFNPRLSKMIDESTVLADLVSTASRSKANRGDLLEYGARARVIKAGANSPDSLRSDHLPYVICDEVDAFPWDVGGEGDPMTLIENRQRTYSRAKTYLISTPTVVPSRIDSQYQRSDRRRYHVPCPHCGELQHLEFGGKEKLHGIKWRIAPKAEGDDGLDQVISAWYVCKECGAEIDEGHKPDMLAKGRWIAERPNIKHHRGYHINALYAPTGLGLNWRKVAQKWLDSQGDTAEMKGFINTYLGEVWEEQGDSIEGLSLISRLEVYGSLPLALITAGVDVQKNRLEASVVGWGSGEEAWLLDHIIIDGDTARPDVWEDLHDVLVEAGVQLAAIDSGYNTSMVYDFVQKRRWARAVKGVTGLHRPLVEDEKKRKQRLRVRSRKGVPVEPLGVDQGKALLYARLKLLQPGPGYVHFKRDAAFDDEYFAQLGAEKLVTKIKGTRPFQEWVQTRPRNEALDCLVYALAACRLAGKLLAAPTVSASEGSAPTSAAGAMIAARLARQVAPTRP